MVAPQQAPPPRPAMVATPIKVGPVAAGRAAAAAARARCDAHVILAAVLAILRAAPRRDGGSAGGAPPRVLLASLGGYLKTLRLKPTAACGGRIQLSRWVVAQPALRTTHIGDVTWVEEASAAPAAPATPAPAARVIGVDAVAAGDGAPPPPPTYIRVTTVAGLDDVAAALAANRTWAVHADVDNHGKTTAIAVATSTPDDCFLLDVGQLADALGRGGVSAALFQPGPTVTILAHDAGALAASLVTAVGAAPDATLRDVQVAAELLTRTPWSPLAAIAAAVDVGVRGLPVGGGGGGARPPAWGGGATAATPPPVAVVRALLAVAPALADRLSATPVGVAGWEAASAARSAAVAAAAAAGTHPPGAVAVAFDASRGGSAGSPEVLAALAAPTVDTRVAVVGAAADLAAAARLLPAAYRGKLLRGAPAASSPNGATHPSVDAGGADEALVTELGAALRDIDLDIGRRPRASFADAPSVPLSDDPADVLTAPELDAFIASVTEAGDGFGRDDRAGICGALHRVSRIRGRAPGEVVGATVRVGRHFRCAAGLLTDLLGLDGGAAVAAGAPRRRSPPRSVLLLGRPGCGKTSTLRAVAAGLAATDLRVAVVDSSAEVGGATAVAHASLGDARRLLIPESDAGAAGGGAFGGGGGWVGGGGGGGRGGKAGLARVLLRALENLTPDVLVVDELSGRADVDAVRAAKERDVAVVATAHGDFRSLLRNEGLRGS
ncbi:hypothetical protein BU14_2018s0001, partial [Porphyra umbilicalis]